MASSATDRLAIAGRITLLVLLCSAVAGCATDGAGLPNVACSVFKPIYPSRKDTSGTIRQVQGYNASGRALCGWKP